MYRSKAGNNEKSFDYTPSLISIIQPALVRLVYLSLHLPIRDFKHDFLSVWCW
jgi:hypothetical protein